MAQEQMPCAHLEAFPLETGVTTFVDRDSAVIVDDEVTTEALACARRGDFAGLHFLYVRHADELCAYLEALVQERDVAEQILDEVFANLPAALAATDERHFSFAGSVLRMATNMAVESLRQRKVVPLRKAGATGDRPGRRPLGRALARLSSEQRDVLVMRHAAGLSPAQSAELLDTDEHSLGRLYDQARSGLRAALHEPAGRQVAAEA